MHTVDVQLSCWKLMKNIIGGVQKVSERPLKKNSETRLAWSQYKTVHTCRTVSDWTSNYTTESTMLMRNFPAKK